MFVIFSLLTRNTVLTASHVMNYCFFLNKNLQDSRIKLPMLSTAVSTVPQQGNI